MQNDIKTKSTDFLPGKPSIDSVAKSSVPPINTDDNLKPIAGPSSAHVIDLKKSSVSPVDSPLLSQNDTGSEIEKPTSIAPEFDGIKKEAAPKSDIVVKPIMEEPTPVASPSASAAEVSNAQSASSSSTDNQEKTDIDNLNLADSSPRQEVKETDNKPKKSSKLKWLLLAFLFIIIGAAIAVGVIYALNYIAVYNIQ